VTFTIRSSGLGTKRLAGQAWRSAGSSTGRHGIRCKPSRAGYPVADKDSGVTVMSLRDSMVGEIRPFLLLLLAAVGFVLLIACVNVANLSSLDPRRTREFAIRSALGATTRRVLRQLIDREHTASVAGGALGLLLRHGDASCTCLVYGNASACRRNQARCRCSFHGRYFAVRESFRAGTGTENFAPGPARR